ncbi:MAG: NUDIX hydrolase [Spongiibacteraceae bacterium]
MSDTTSTENSLPAGTPTLAEKPPIAAPVPAATILLLRDGADGLEVFMQKRYVSSDPVDRFGGALIFPGGKVDVQDHDPVLRAYSRVAADIDDFQFALRIGAIREAFEECGVLLARPRGDDNVVSAERLLTLQTWRDRLNAGEITLADFVQSENLELACDLLVFYAHWITPPARLKRFDTYFFLAPAPHDHQLFHDGRESTDSLWTTVEDALAGGREKRHNIVFPTRSNLEKLAFSTTLATALDTAAKAVVVTVQPRVEKREDGIYVVIPKEAGYPNCEDKPEMRG